MLVLLF